MKRLFDLLAASVLLVCTAPLFALSALAVRITSRGPILYRAPRTGRSGQYFEMYKFRTMRTGSDRGGQMVTAHNDSRVTAAGAFLRATKLDELPQLFNVLRGEMSIVGPRPEDWGIVARHYSPDQRRTLDTRPGIASYAELRWYPDLTYHDPPPAGVSPQSWYVERHLPAELEESQRYLDEQSLRLDTAIIFRTAWNVVRYSFVDPPKQRLDA